MENHPVMFVFIAIAGVFYLIYHAVKLTIILLIVAYKFIVKKITRSVDINVVNR